MLCSFPPGTDHRGRTPDSTARLVLAHSSASSRSPSARPSPTSSRSTLASPFDLGDPASPYPFYGSPRMTDPPGVSRLTRKQLREAYVLTVAGVKAKSSLKDYVPVANEVGAGIIARNRLDTVDFVFRDKEACDRAYAALETGFARYLLTRFAQYNLYIAPRPCARVAFAQMTSLEEAVYDESRRIYLDDAFKPVEYDPLVAAVHAASRTTPRWHDSSDATSSVGRSTASSFVDEPGGSGRGGDDDDDARGPGPGGPAIARAGTSNATSLDSRPSGTW